MLPVDTVLNHEIPVIRKIIADETWLEGERRGCAVSPDDYIVREKVCTIVLQIGQQLRESITHSLRAGSELLLPETATYCAECEWPEMPLDWEI